MNTQLSPVVLMYHAILPSHQLTVPYQRETGAELYDVSLENFKAQMKHLKEQGCKADQDVIITFDDGEMNNFQYAFPVLKDIGWKAYFFIVAKRVGKNGYMGWNELKEMSQAGMMIGSHGLSHEILTNLLDSQMEEELKASKRVLEMNLGIEITSLSIPRGFCNDKVIKTAYALGYQKIFISHKPHHLKSACLTRTAVKSHWSLKRFEAALKGRTPWSEMVGEFIKKALKTILRESGYNWVRGLIIKMTK